MTYFAEIGKDNKVLRVIVADKEFIDSGKVGDPVNWIESWVETDGIKNPRKNPASIGYIYDKLKDAFIPFQPFPSWILDKSGCKWKAPKAAPTDGKIYEWDELGNKWVEKKPLK